MRIALLQINPTVGDLAGNARLIAEAAREAARQGANLAVTPELALVGYLPRDLLLSHGFIRRSWDVLADLSRELAGAPPVLVGLAEPNPSDEGRPLYNAAVLLRAGRVDQRFRKALLPTYDVFDEDRYFEPYRGPQILDRQPSMAPIEPIERASEHGPGPKHHSHGQQADGRNDTDHGQILEPVADRWPRPCRHRA